MITGISGFCFLGPNMAVSWRICFLQKKGLLKPQFYSVLGVCAFWAKLSKKGNFGHPPKKRKILTELKSSFLSIFWFFLFFFVFFFFDFWPPHLALNPPYLFLFCCCFFCFLSSLLLFHERTTSKCSITKRFFINPFSFVLLSSLFFSFKSPFLIFVFSSF